MAKKKLDKETDRTPSSPSKIVAILKNETVHFVIGLMLVIFSVYLLLAFSSFFFTGAADQSILDSGNPADLSVVDNHVKNYAGSRGAQLASYLINDCFGISSFFILVFLAVAGLKLMRVRIVRLWKWFIGCTLLLIWFSIFFGFTFMDHYQDSFIYLGGMHGYNVSRWLVSQVGVPGVWMILLITAICFFIYISARTVVWLRKLFALSFLKRKKREEVEAAPAVGGEPEFATSQPQEVEFELKRTYKQTPPAPVMDIQSEEHEEEEDFPVNQQETEESSSLSEESEGVTMVFEPAASNSVVSLPKVSLPKEPAEDEEPGFEVESAVSEEEYQGPEVEPYNPTKDLENYRFPTIDLMKHFENDDPTIDMDEQNANKDRIINTLRSFGIEISTIKATVGPTVTLYEITPEQGVRISKIRGLEDDIALSLSADGIRIIAPIPGKGTIGIEVPNKNPKIVSGQSVIGSKKFQESKFDLPIVLGKTITNEVFMFDLCKMPHVLVAGATGQGKSVGLNAIITSLLYKKHPAELKFVLVDPKKVEFSIYSVIENHFLAKLPDGGEPIITDVTKVVQTLNSVCVEMDTRYDLLKMAHVRNVKEYNEKFVNRRLNPEKGHKFMPYIVVVIDEFGDLIMTAGKEVELPIARIAQLARAVGIHMIIATQRPTTNIITGTIKANFPARIAFRVSAMMDSRTILDRPGANRLIGKGDMLFLQGADPVRVQCAFIDTPEVEEITKFIARQQSYPTPFFLPEYVSEDSGSEVGDIDMGRLDPLFEDAARLVVIHQQGSTSLIQRKFAIGYNRAGRIMDQLEKAGIVGPTQGSKARDVLCIDDNDLEMRLNNLQ
ncbi:DNA translocase FtsK [Bacteroides acidifaciens]|uniref:DNA translocase FtsK n=7 Tax=Bacteroides TaxID=816 RepID=A0A7K3MI40_9BACE|nr:DNA translocase FtsK [Bacteroides acidifaciens]MBF0728025.1 DNA translocase FtsK [Bacteroides acidifaciens]MBF0836764.1 DNA translocase FtsK [Bacteroides acidifaciens]NDO53998.1 DNA translocase FtsK [Bacteroides acidifaciens]TFU53262.1 DNA translocase FtsK [Bacteroides acidifaciens]GFH85916.1 DNA translocase SpoIIIE [Bacteroides acidifaciens]